MLNYVAKTGITCIRSWTRLETLTRKKCGFLTAPRTLLL